MNNVIIYWDFDQLETSCFDEEGFSLILNDRIQVWFIECREFYKILIGSLAIHSWV